MIACFCKNDLDNINDWCKLNGMILEINKCNVITFGGRNKLGFDYKIDDISIDPVKIVKDLGIYFEDSLSFQGHVD